jgi:hypothetical protein
MHNRQNGSVSHQTLASPLKQPHPDGAGEVWRCGGGDPFAVDLGDQRAQGQRGLGGGGAQRVPVDGLKADRGFMSGNRHRTLHRGMIGRHRDTMAGVVTKSKAPAPGAWSGGQPSVRHAGLTRKGKRATGGNPVSQTAKAHSK